MKRAGVSPVIATLLLIVIAVAAAVLAYIWIIGYQGTLTQQASTAQLQERIKIEAVEYTMGTFKCLCQKHRRCKSNVDCIICVMTIGNYNWQAQTVQILNFTLDK